MGGYNMNDVNENIVNFRQLIDIAERNDSNHIVYEFKQNLRKQISRNCKS